MTFEPHLHIIQQGVEQRLEAFTTATRDDHSEQWRCLYAPLPAAFTLDHKNKRIILEFMKESFFDADAVEAFYVTSGHLFIFFQGHVRAIIRGFEQFLQTLFDDKATPEKLNYQFFWELNHFWGFFDEVLVSAIQKKNTPDIPPVTDDEHRKRSKPLALILEDDRTTRHIMQKMLQQYCDIAVAWNGKQAALLYEHLKPDITFLDIQVPYGDGEELATTLCTNDPEAFIIVVSGALTTGKIKRCRDAGVKGCVAKPPTPENLLPYIYEYLQQTQQQKRA